MDPLSPGTMLVTTVCLSTFSTLMVLSSEEVRRQRRSTRHEMEVMVAWCGFTASIVLTTGSVQLRPRPRTLPASVPRATVSLSCAPKRRAHRGEDVRHRRDGAVQLRAPLLHKHEAVDSVGEVLRGRDAPLDVDVAVERVFAHGVRPRLQPPLQKGSRHEGAQERRALVRAGVHVQAAVVATHDQRAVVRHHNQTAHDDSNGPWVEDGGLVFQRQRAPRFDNPVGGGGEVPVEVGVRSDGDDRRLVVARLVLHTRLAAVGRVERARHHIVRLEDLLARHQEGGEGVPVDAPAVVGGVELEEAREDVRRVHAAAERAVQQPVVLREQTDELLPRQPGDPVL
eukprot:Rhum_TRINITY_DN554_c0_g1::Rhum_TRINITY_DN554_c0_g1_i1::g.1738::m.1738